MSATARSTATRPSGRAASAPRPAASRRPSRAALREVPAPAPAVAGPGIFSLVVLGVLVGGAVLLLVLNTSLAQGAFELSELSKEQRELAVSEQTLLQEVARAESPESLQRRAEALGMVPVAAPVFLRLADGTVLGVPRPAKADPLARTVPVTGGTARTASTSRADAKPSASAAAAAAGVAGSGAAGDAAVADPMPADDAAVPDQAVGARP